MVTCCWGLLMAKSLMWAAWLALLVRLVSAVLLAFLVSVVWTALQSCLDRVRLTQDDGVEGDHWIDISSLLNSAFSRRTATAGRSWPTSGNPLLTRV